MREAIDGLQLPWVSSSLEREFYLNSSGEHGPVASSAPAEGPISVASVLWSEIHNSTDPADFDGFLASFPASPMASQADLRREELVRRGATSHPLRLPQPAPRRCRARSRATPRPATWSAPTIRARCGSRQRCPPVVNTRLAIRSCAQDLARDPDNPRLLFQLRSALDIAERFDYERSPVYYREAALRGNDRGRVGIARAYREGWGVEQSFVDARSWLQLSVANFWPNAMDNLALYYRDGLGVAADLGEAFDLYQRAANLGQTAGMDNLRMMYARGQHVVADQVEANRWSGRLATSAIGTARSTSRSPI